MYLNRSSYQILTDAHVVLSFDVLKQYSQLLAVLGFKL